ncbi:MAG: hypothetical protein OXN81_09335, partial [Alphaproteobacteria bacterium]|nr:hypothetical protein [Alphaproteobacteria bacterium]
LPGSYHLTVAETDMPASGPEERVVIANCFPLMTEVRIDVISTVRLRSGEGLARAWADRTGSRCQEGGTWREIGVRRKLAARMTAIDVV